MYVGAEFVGGILGTVGTWIAYGSLAREVALLAATFPRRCKGPQGAFGGDSDRFYPGLHSDLGSHRREGRSGRGPPGGRVLAALLYDSFISEAETPD